MTVVDASQLYGTLPKWGNRLFEVRFKFKWPNLVVRTGAGVMK